MTYNCPSTISIWKLLTFFPSTVCDGNKLPYRRRYFLNIIHVMPYWGLSFRPTETKRLKLIFFLGSSFCFYPSHLLISISLFSHFITSPKTTHCWLPSRFTVISVKCQNKSWTLMFNAYDCESARESAMYSLHATLRLYFPFLHTA